ncbi:alpha/beta hydrolase [uncultured Jatrophihabitans sp.]|uniref:alpha/beta hydrolase n=1 Tax=uncultured Jatrophihabitans sp. TaxID=1610747 RepID=UPI0035C9BF2D
MPRSPGSRARLSLVGAALAVTTLVAACTSTVDGTGSTGSPSAAQSSFPASSSASSGAGSAPPQAPAKFGSCAGLYNTSAVTLPSDRAGKIEFSCAQIRVPLDYAEPNGRTISLELVRVHDRDNTSSKGSLLVNPGGPGASGNVFALGYTASVPLTLLKNFDLIGFDPRGIGASSPINCLSDAQKDTINAASPDIRTSAGFASARSTAAMIARSCSSKYGSALPQYNTVNTARDMDQIRRAVGDEQMNYLGFSYGTELGSIYAHLFPSVVRVMVLDGAVNPLTSDITAFADQLQGFESSFDQFATYCRAHSPCKSLGDPRSAVYAIQAKAKASPIPTSAAGDSRKATLSLVTTGVLQALYSESEWPTLGNALVQARKGDSAGLLQLADDYNQRYDGKYTNISDANTTIGCNDSKNGPTDAQIRATAKQWATRFPIFGLQNASSLFTCQQWQKTRTALPLPTAKTPIKVLVVGNLHDPATPYKGAVDLARTMGNAELLSWDGEGHTSFGQGSSCVDNYVERYLVDRTLPPNNKTCPK